MRWFLLMAVMAMGLRAEGLSWTDVNQDRECDKAATREAIAAERWPCSTAQLAQADVGTRGVKSYTLFVHLFLYPIVPKQDRDSVSMSVVVETADHVKHTYSLEKLRIETKAGHISPEELPAELRRQFPDGMSTTTRSCHGEIDLGGAGAVSVLAVDAYEEDSKGRILARHTFR